mgnify:CR=1 FL=1
MIIFGDEIEARVQIQKKAPALMAALTTVQELDLAKVPPQWGPHNVGLINSADLVEIRVRKGTGAAQSAPIPTLQGGR